MSVRFEDHRLLGYLSLFTSLGTVVCCALPALLVFAGMGSTVVAILNAAPWLVDLSRHKAWVFAFAGSWIAMSFGFLYLIAPRLKAETDACNRGPSDPCSRTERLSRRLLWLSAGLFAAGFFMAYMLVPLLELLR